MGVHIKAYERKHQLTVLSRADGINHDRITEDDRIYGTENYAK